MYVYVNPECHWLATQSQLSNPTIHPSNRNPSIQSQSIHPPFIQSLMNQSVKRHTDHPTNINTTTIQTTTTYWPEHDKEDPVKRSRHCCPLPPPLGTCHVQVDLAMSVGCDVRWCQHCLGCDVSTAKGVMSTRLRV